LSRRVIDGAVACSAPGPASSDVGEAGSPFCINIGGRNEMIRTGMNVKKGNKTFYLDDPKQRQRYVKNMSPREKEKFAKRYVRYILETQEQELWFKRMRMK
jgi:hypothetical protein